LRSLRIGSTFQIFSSFPQNSTSPGANSEDRKVRRQTGQTVGRKSQRQTFAHSWMHFKQKTCPQDNDWELRTLP
jgi:hypothetical protein